VWSFSDFLNFYLFKVIQRAYSFTDVRQANLPVASLLADQETKRSHIIITSWSTPQNQNYPVHLSNLPTSSHWGQGPKYPLGTLWTHWEHRQHVTLICPVIKCWVHFKYTPLCDPNMPSGYILSTFWMCPAMWLQCTQWANNWAHFECSAKCDHNVPSGIYSKYVFQKCSNVSAGQGLISFTMDLVMWL